MTLPAGTSPILHVTEEQRDAAVPLWEHPDWRDRFPWLVAATTGAGESLEQPFDLGLFGTQPVGPAIGRWHALRRATGMETAVHAHQVHGADLRLHAGPLAPGLLVMTGVDGHLTNRPGILLAVAVADCVPVFMVDAEQRAIALLHAGWRGTAAGIVERAVRRMSTEFDSRPADLWLHCGPAICGECYEVGPEVHRAIHPTREPPPEAEPIDLRAAIRGRGEALNVPAGQISVSEHCTRCGPGRFFSHRAGSAARQMGVLGIRLPSA